MWLCVCVCASHGNTLCSEWDGTPREQSAGASMHMWFVFLLDRCTYLPCGPPAAAVGMAGVRAGCGCKPPCAPQAHVFVCVHLLLTLLKRPQRMLHCSTPPTSLACCHSRAAPHLPDNLVHHLLDSFPAGMVCGLPGTSLDSSAGVRCNQLKEASTDCCFFVFLCMGWAAPVARAWLRCSPPPPLPDVVTACHYPASRGFSTTAHAPPPFVLQHQHVQEHVYQ